MTGILPEAHETMIKKAILPYLKEEKTDVASPSSFWCTYVFEEMAQRGYAKEVLSFIHKNWRPMIKTGTTWEVFTWTPRDGYSSTHAWSAHPSFHLVNILSGITQLSQGWKKIKFAPYFAEDINSAESIVPTPEGKIKTEWKRDKQGDVKVQLSLPEGVSAEIDLPGSKKNIKGPGNFETTVKA